MPPKPFFDDPQWRGITDWHEELTPYYDQARRMLGVRLNPTMTPSDVHLKAAAERMGCGDTFHMAPVGVFFGDGEDADGTAKAGPGEQVPDPYFGGAGPDRKACNECGECMTGCRHGAKNTLNENYLYLAEKAGAVVHPMTTAVSVTDDSRGGFAVATLPTDRKKRGKRGKQQAGRTFTARRVVLAAGTYGTQTLLHRMKAGGQLPRLSDVLGELTRTNSEALVAPRPTTGATAAPPGSPGPTSRAASPSRPPSTRTPTPTSSRSVTARAPTRWAACPSSRSPTPGRPPRAPRASWASSATRPSTRCWSCVRSPTASGRSGPSSAWSCSPWTTP